MSQLSFWRQPHAMVNVASVPHRSPFRYPGGKTWLVPRVRQWLGGRTPRPRLLIEPFAGGGIISLTVAAENLAERVMMVEIDEDVAAVWKTILSNDVSWLIDRIGSFSVTPAAVESRLSAEPTSVRERAFNTILKNRCYHGGILAPGSSPMKAGENGKGISSRWYPATLQKRIRAIADMGDRVSFAHGDGIDALRDNADDEAVAFFIDPPYSAGGKRAGRRLYTHSELDHRRLFDVCEGIRGDFLMTYDMADEIMSMAESHGFCARTVPMKNTHHAKMREVLIGRHLSWFD